MWQFWESTLENWQSEFLQMFSFAVLSALFIHRGSAESKDSDEQIKRAWTGSRSASRPWKAGRKARQELTPERSITTHAR